MIIKNYKSLFENNFKIYCDMDGVLVDFDNGFKKVSGLLPKEYVTKYSNNAFWKVIRDTKNYWLNLEWIKDGRKLWSYIKKYNPIILTTPGGDIEECKQQKTKWIQKELGNIMIVFSDSKENYANSNSILIDDNFEKNISPWITKGGIGILHKNTKSTIQQLQKYT